MIDRISYSKKMMPDGEGVISFHGADIDTLLERQIEEIENCSVTDALAGRDWLSGYPALLRLILVGIERVPLRAALSKLSPRRGAILTENASLEFAKKTGKKRPST